MQSNSSIRPPHAVSLSSRETRYMAHQSGNIKHDIAKTFDAKDQREIFKFAMTTHNNFVLRKVNLNSLWTTLKGPILSRDRDSESLIEREGARGVEAKRKSQNEYLAECVL